MSNERVKVYVGRRSMSAGDDMFVPNMTIFYLPESLSEFAAQLHRLLPFDSWTCFLGDPTHDIAGEPDGVMVSRRRDDRPLLRVEGASPTGSSGCGYSIVEHAEDWRELITAHPYLFCE